MHDARHEAPLGVFERGDDGRGVADRHDGDEEDEGKKYALTETATTPVVPAKVRKHGIHRAEIDHPRPGCVRMSA